MRRLVLVFCAFGVFCFGNSEMSSLFETEMESIIKQDLDLREQWMNTNDPAIKEQVAKEIREQEIVLTQQLHKILINYGMPSYEYIEEVSQLIVRSSDLDFQKEMLEIMGSLENECWNHWIPILTDRVLLRQNLPQRYGTHLHLNDRSYVPYPIENYEKVDSLRRTFGQLPLQKYIEKVRLTILAIEKRELKFSQKLFFNEKYNFYENPDDYLYCVTFVPTNPGLQEWHDNKYRNSSYFSGSVSKKPEDLYEIHEEFVPQLGAIFAFEHPAHAAIHALHELGWNYEIQERTEFDDDDYETEEEKKDDIIICFKDPINYDGFHPSFIGIQPFLNPCYVFLLPKKEFDLYRYSDRFFDKIYISTKHFILAPKVICGSIFDPLLAIEKTIKFESGRSSTALKSWRNFDSSDIGHFLFDITLENENFDSP